MKSAIDRMPMDITAYTCIVCDKWHRKGSDKFEAHFNANAKERGWALRTTPPEERRKRLAREKE